MQVLVFSRADRFLDRRLATHVSGDQRLGQRHHSIYDLKIPLGDCLNTTSDKPSDYLQPDI